MWTILGMTMPSGLEHESLRTPDEQKVGTISLSNTRSLSTYSPHALRTGENREGIGSLAVYVSKETILTNTFMQGARGPP